MCAPKKCKPFYSDALPRQNLIFWQVSKLFRELDMLEGQGHFGNRHGRSWKVLNKTARLLQCRLDPAPLECRSHWVLSSEIPEAVAREYLTFSFVREPFSRFLSAHREVLVQNVLTLQNNSAIEEEMVLARDI